jgi:hypothetical protein
MISGKILRAFLGLRQGLIPQEQQRDRYSDAVGVSRAIGASYIESDTANKLLGKLPETALLIRGHYHVEERNQWIFLVLNKDGSSEIGSFNYVTGKYCPIVHDEDLDCPIGLDACTWIQITGQVFGVCSYLKIYFSTNNEYRVFDIDLDCNYDDTKLMTPACVGDAIVTPVKGGGTLRNGIYQVTLQLSDGLHGETNFGCFSQKVDIADENCQPGEDTNWGLLIRYNNLPEGFTQARLVVREQTDQGPLDKVIDNLSTSSETFSYTYTGQEGTFQNSVAELVRSREQKVFKGSGITSHDGKAIIYNVEPTFTPNIQKYVSMAKIRYERFMVPVNEADQWPQLRPNEKSSWSLRLNWADGRKDDRTYLFIPHYEGGDYPDLPNGHEENCSCCNMPGWMRYDTSKRIQQSAWVEGGEIKQGELCETNDCDPGFDVNLTVEECTDQCTDKLKIVSDGKIILHEENFELSCTAEGEAILELPCKGEYCVNVTIEKEDGCVYHGSYTASKLENMTVTLDLKSCLKNEQSECKGVEMGELATESTELNMSSSVSFNPPPTEEEEEESADVRADDFEEQDNQIEEEVDEEVECCCNYLQKAIYTLIRCALEWFGKEVEEGFPQCPCQEKACSIEVGPGIVFREGPISAGACSVEGAIRKDGTVTWRCEGGEWILQESAGNVQTTVTNRSDESFAAPRTTELVNNFNPNGDPVNSEGEIDCFDKSTKPIPFSKGEFGYWETDNEYPRIVICNEEGKEELMFGDMTGKKERLYRHPSITKEPIHISLSKGVEWEGDPTNDSCNNTMAIVTGICIEGLVLPKQLMDQLCKDRPFDVLMADRKEHDKTVLSTGFLHSMFAIDIQGTEYLVAKNAVNSFELYDAASNPGGTNVLRRGRTTDIPMYAYHSPDFHLWQNYQEGQYILVEQEQYGEGRRLGDYAEGNFPEDFRGDRCHNAGRRSSIAITQHKPVSEDYQPIVKCIKEMAELPFDGYVGKEGKFSRAVINKYRERAQLIELEGDKLEFMEDAKGAYGSTNGGDNASDNSFIGDTIDHEAHIYNARTHLATVMRYLPNQYGGIINRAYVPVGLTANAETLKKGKLVGIAGDSFVGAFKYRRTAFISDKTKEEIAPRDLIGLNPFEPDGEGAGPLISVLETILDNLFLPITAILDFIDKLLSSQKCGEPAESGETDTDSRNDMSLRRGMRARPSDGANVAAPTGGTCPDSFAPMVLKTLIKGYFVSDANLKRRATGDVIIGDEKKNAFGQAFVHADKLRTLSFDAAFPKGSDYVTSWMPRFYALMRQPSGLKKFMRDFVCGAIIYLVPIWIWVQGFKGLLSGFGLIGSGTFGLGSIGGGLQIILGVLLIGAAIAWREVFRRQRFLIERTLDRRFQIDWCHRDRDLKNEGEGQGCSWAMDKGRVVQLEDNYFSYNVNYSQRNLVEIAFGIEAKPDFSSCKGEVNGVIRSSYPQDVESHIDVWGRFRTLSRTTTNLGRGKIQRVESMQSGLFVWTTESLFRVNFARRQSGDTFLGDTIFAGQPTDMYGGVIEGGSGLQDPNSLYITAAGAFWPDEKGRKWKMFNGSTVTDISFANMPEFFNCNMEFCLSKQFPNYKNRDQKNGGIGYDFAIDYQKEEVYLYKRDFEVNISGVRYVPGRGFFKGEERLPLGGSAFDNKSWMVVYNLRSQEYTSRHLYNPDFMLWNRHHHFDVKRVGSQIGIYTHDVKDRFSEYFGKQQPMFVDMPINGIPEGISKSFRIKRIVVVGEVLDYSGAMPKRLLEPAFDQVQLYDGENATNWIELTEASTNRGSNAKASLAANWRDEENCVAIEGPFNGSEISTNENYGELNILEPCSEGNELRGNWMGIRLISRKEPHKKVVWRRILLDIEYEEENILNIQI